MSELVDGREALAYWEQRARTLPRRSIRGRREARDLAARWSERVAAEEAATYGRGLPGALWLLVAEGRVPEPARRTGRELVHRGSQALAIAGLICATVMALALVLVAELIAAIF